MNDTLYVILNGSLNMSAGKAAAQAVHAAMMLTNTDRTNFMSNYRRTVIVLEAKNREQLDGICDYLASADINYRYYVDEGVNEVDAFSFTAMAVEPFDSDSELPKLFADLPLYGKIDYDDYPENGCSEENEDVARYRQAYYDANKKVQELTQLLNKPKWYQKLFRRKPHSFVS